MGGAGGLTKVGSGTLLLSNSNVYAGPTEVDAGTLKLTNGNGLAISGFNNGTGWSVNSYAEATPAFSGGTATLTDNIFVSGQARAIWYDTPVATNGFSTTFIYTVGGNKVADGITFCLQTAGSGRLMAPLPAATSDTMASHPVWRLASIFTRPSRKPVPAFGPAATWAPTRPTRAPCCLPTAAATPSRSR